MEFIIMLLSIIMVNILLSGDNALVIALASRKLPQEQKKKAIFWGSTGAVGLRVLLTFAAIILLKIPYLQLVGGLLLLWIAIKLIAEDQEETKDIEAKTNLLAAIKTIIMADLVMSLDNVIAIAGVAKGNVALLIIGLGISIPLIIWGSKAIGFLMEKWPIIIIIGAAFLGWTAGEMVIADTKIAPFLVMYPLMHWVIPTAFTVIVVVAGKLLSRQEHEPGRSY